MGYFDNVSTAQVGISRDYLLAGKAIGDKATYLCRLGAVELGKTRPPAAEGFVAAELEVISAAGTSVTSPVGSKPKWFAKFKWDSTLGLFKRLCAVSLNIPEEAVDAGGCEAAVGKDQPLKGALVRVDVEMVTTKGGGTFTTFNFRLPTAEELKAYGTQGHPQTMA